MTPVGDTRRVADWDAGKLVRHRTRLRRLDLPVADHHASGEPLVRAARLWAAADIERWLSAPTALAAAVASPVEAGCGGWPLAARDPERLGGFDLVHPDGRRLAIDLTADDAGRTVCRVQSDKEQPAELFDYADRCSWSGSRPGCGRSASRGGRRTGRPTRPESASPDRGAWKGCQCPVKPGPSTACTPAVAPAARIAASRRT